MKLSDLFITEAPNVFHKTWKAWFLGTSFDGFGQTKDQALDAVVAHMRHASDNRGSRAYRFAANGAVFCLYWAYDCWCYDITSPNHTYPSSCHMNVTTFSEALALMEQHVAHYGS